MPTARELLEQADALMRRRNLSPDAATPPVSDARQAASGPQTDSRFAPTDGAPLDERPPPQLPPLPEAAPPATPSSTPASTPSAVAALSGLRWSSPAPTPGVPMTSPVFAPPPSRSPRTIQREPIAPSVARTALPVEPGESSIDSAPTTEAFSAAYAPDPDFPLLTDAVPIDELARLAAAEDLPVLTEAIDAGEDEPILEDLDEPSVWSPTFGAAPTVARPAPLAAGPEVGDEPPAPAGSRDPLGLDRPPPGFEAPSTAQWTAADDAALPGEAAAAEPPVAEALSAGSGDAALDVASEQAAVPGFAEAEPEDALAEPPPEPAEPAWAEVAPAAIVAMAGELPAALPRERAAADDSAPSSPGDEPDETPVAAPVDARAGETLVALPAAPAATIPDDARVREIAEEIGMQVLQRIDIFTDTELRARLGERLKPVVDRVSAELVAAINQHVGELLRVYVAEAIEREIERWRDRQS